MDTSIDISIIIPIFNAGEHLPKCLSSAANQTGAVNFEVILVDDGSTDDSPQIENQWAGMDSRFRVFHLAKPNMGPSRARNKGLKEAKGAYVFFLDADDVLLDNALEVLFESATRHHADLVLGDFMAIRNGHDSRNGVFHFPGSRRLQHEEICELVADHLRKPMNGSPLGPVWAKLYRLSLIAAHSIRFIETMRNGEDFVFNMEYAGFIQTMAYIRKNIYGYHLHPGKETLGAQKVAPLLFKDQIHPVLSALQRQGMAASSVESLHKHGVIYLAVKSILFPYINALEGKTPDFLKTHRERQAFIKDILWDPEVRDCLKEYAPLPGESAWIPLFMRLRLPIMVEIAARFRAARIVRERRKREQA